LGLFDAFPPPAQMLEIGPYFPSILLFDPERVEHRHNRPRDDGINLVVVKPLLLGDRFGDYGPDVLVSKFGHRLISLTTFLKPRLLEAPVMMVRPRLPPLVQIDDSADFSRVSVQAI
jgi:hypothetical protein